jgi:oligopeptide/dipeptide ABC transporter ATP-binding protein
MLADPQDQLVDFLDSTRIFRRLVRRRLWDEGLRLAVERLRDVKIPEPERIAGQYPFELSGGMRQRAMIAMMMACSPNLLIADEPTTALDVTVEAQILTLMKELQVHTNMAILLITHDLGVVAEVCDKVGVMYAGNVVEFGTAEEIFHRTLHPYTDGLMRSIPRFLGQVAAERKRELYIIRGTVPNLLRPPSGCRFHPRCPRALDVCATVVPALEPMGPGHLAACHNPIPSGGTPG